MRPSELFATYFVLPAHVTPLRSESEPLLSAGPETYPHPVVDYEAAARQARDQVWGLRKGQGYRCEAEAIQRRHGSRRRRRARPPADNGQLSLELG